MNAYAIWKTAHILSAAVLFGTGLGIAFFAWCGYRRALRTREIDGLRAILRLTVIADMVFTAPAVVFQIISGLALMRANGWPLVSPWSITVYTLFVITGICWLPVVWLQVVLSGEAHRAISVDALPRRFHRRVQTWLMLGVPAFGAVLAIYWMMAAIPLAVLP